MSADVFHHARDGRELVENSLELDRGDRGALQRGEQDAAQRVAERRAEASLQRLAREAPVGLGRAFVLGLESPGPDQFAPVACDEFFLHGVPPP